MAFDEVCADPLDSWSHHISASTYVVRPSMILDKGVLEPRAKSASPPHLIMCRESQIITVFTDETDDGTVYTFIVGAHAAVPISSFEVAVSTNSSSEDHLLAALGFGGAGAIAC